MIRSSKLAAESLCVFALIAVIFSSSPNWVTFAANPLYYVPVVITNNQDVPVAAGTQVRIVFNPSSYSYLRNDLGNIRFYRGNDWLDQNRMYAWVENGTSVQTQVVVWLRLIDPIPAKGDITVYMAVMPVNVGYDAVFWGRYGGWYNYGPDDNGKYVFNFYDHFGGTAFNSTKWPITQTCNRGEIDQDNAVIIYGGSSPCSYTGIGNSIAVDPRNVVMDWLGYSYESSETLSGFFVSSRAADTAGAANPRIYQHHVGGTYRYDLCNGDLSCVKFPVNPTTNVPEVYSIWADFAQAHMTMNYFAGTEVTNNASFAAAPGMGIMFNAGSGFIWVGWVRIRNQPPNNANPSATLLAEESGTPNITQTSSSALSSTIGSIHSTSLSTSSTTTTTQVLTAATSLRLTTTKTTTLATTLTYISTATTQPSPTTAATSVLIIGHTTPFPATAPPVGGTVLIAIAVLLAIGLVAAILGARLFRRPARPVGHPEEATQVIAGEPGSTGLEAYDRVDRIVLTYLEKHAGEISISKAVQELGISESELKASLSRLTNKGKIQRS